jgi:hypothetical protein
MKELKDAFKETPSTVIGGCIFMVAVYILLYLVNYVFC